MLLAHVLRMVDRNRLLTEVNCSLLGLYCTVWCTANRECVHLSKTNFKVHELLLQSNAEFTIWTKLVLIGGCYPDNVLTFVEIGFSILLFVHAEIFGFATFGVPLSGGVIALDISSNLS